MFLGFIKLASKCLGNHIFVSGFSLCYFFSDDFLFFLLCRLVLFKCFTCQRSCWE